MTLHPRIQTQAEVVEYDDLCASVPERNLGPATLPCDTYGAVRRGQTLTLEQWRLGQ